MITKKSLRKLLAVGCCALSLSFAVGGSNVAFASSQKSATQEKVGEAQQKLNEKMANAVENKTYTVEGGGTVEGKVVYDSSNIAGGYVNKTVFDELDKKGQEQFLSDMSAAADAVIAEDKAALQNGNPSSSMVTTATKENWLANLQKGTGAGSALMRQVTSQNQLNFAEANRILTPFNGLAGTAMAVGAIVLMSILGIVFVLDLSYIALPPFRMMCDAMGGENGKDTDGPKFISYEAKSAIKLAEEQGQDAGKKVAVAEYFKKRIIMLIALGLCLAYLVNNQLYTFVGWILDLCSQILGF